MWPVPRVTRSVHLFKECIFKRNFSLKCQIKSHLFEASRHKWITYNPTFDSQLYFTEWMIEAPFGASCSVSICIHEPVMMRRSLQERIQKLDRSNNLSESIESYLPRPRRPFVFLSDLNGSLAEEADIFGWYQRQGADPSFLLFLFIQISWQQFRFSVTNPIFQGLLLIQTLYK